jgi:hypothetical protein
LNEIAVRFSSHHDLDGSLSISERITGIVTDLFAVRGFGVDSVVRRADSWLQRDNLMPPESKNLGCGHPCRPPADDHNLARFVRELGSELLLPSHAWMDGAGDRLLADKISKTSLVTRDTGSDLLFAAFLHFIGEIRIRQQGSTKGNEIGAALFDQVAQEGGEHYFPAMTGMRTLPNPRQMEIASSRYTWGETGGKHGGADIGYLSEEVKVPAETVIPSTPPFRAARGLLQVIGSTAGDEFILADLDHMKVSTWLRISGNDLQRNRQRSSNCPYRVISVGEG